MAPRPPERGEVDLRALVPGEGDLELEIGFGRGRFLLERARAAPGARILGLEIKAKLAYQVAQRIERLGLANARAYCADARELLARAGPDGCLARAFLHFPDPWWKKRHAKRRVLDADVVSALARLVAPGGELFVQTDVEERAAEMAAELAAEHRFVVERAAANLYGARSNREARADEDGLPVHRLVARRLG